MKKTILIVACVSLSVAVIISSSLAGPGPFNLREKRAADKVLKDQDFTPTLTIEGPSNSVWLVAARNLGTNLIEQVAIHVAGQVVNVQVEMCQRGAQGWMVSPMRGTAFVTDLQHKIENELGKVK